MKFPISEFFSATQYLKTLTRGKQTIFGFNIIIVFPRVMNVFSEPFVLLLYNRTLTKIYEGYIKSNM